ncbi:NHL repeat-containing protein [Chitinophaga arvensicola]|uniref:Lipoprotein n=1 Tax=Chitinophaga arvensicola TaxID=29529 RepID=A0A1I0S9D8_9BACT|nr:hypothetical protein [Chitinophaga arvensicola]SEW52788.1 hypothetical protein SAMN04488122_5115 [Chitinophaga arvensicola]
MKSMQLNRWAILPAFMILGACSKDPKNNTSAPDKDKLVVVTSISNGTSQVSYVGTMKDLSVGVYNNNKARPSSFTPFIYTHNDDVFVVPNRGADILKKYTRAGNGVLAESGSLTMPAASQPTGIAFESDTSAYCTLYNTGVIVKFNPTTMAQTGTIDVKTFAVSGSTPNPGNIVYQDGRLFVAVTQTVNGYTSVNPAQVLIVDLKQGNKITSTTDARTTWAGTIDAPRSLFFDEQGDLYVNCVASYGFVPGQESGILRIRKGASTFDPGYFFPISKATIKGLSAQVNYFHHLCYGGNGQAYASGNIPSLVSNPPNYVTDRSYGIFKLDLAAKTITKMDIPNTNGYSGYIVPFENKILFSVSSATGVGIYTFDPATNTSSNGPVVTTLGDPSVVEVFK